MRDYLLPGMRIEQQMAVLEATTTHEQHCIGLISDAMRSRRIQFARSSVELRSASASLLDELAQILSDCPDAKIEITGHTDNTGDETSNLAISDARANAVADYLASRGILPSRLTAIGVGSSQPLTDGTSRADLRRNRRIEIETLFPDP